MSEVKKSEKYYPKIGEELYLYQKTGNMWVDEVKRPYTVIDVSPSHVTIQAAKCIFNGPQYYDTLADDIVADKNGRIKVLNWAPRKRKWQVDEAKTGFPEFACFGKYEYQPYLD